MSEFDPTVSEGQFSRPGEWVQFASTRVTEGRYDYGLHQVHVIFRDGTPWVYENVPETVWRRMQRTASAGKFINHVLDNYPYHRGGFDYAARSDIEE